MRGYLGEASSVVHSRTEETSTNSWSHLQMQLVNPQNDRNQKKRRTFGSSGNRTEQFSE